MGLPVAAGVVGIRGAVLACTVVPNTVVGLGVAGSVVAVVTVCFLVEVAFLFVAATVVGGGGGVGVGGADTVVLLIAVVGGGRVAFREVFLVGSGAFTITKGFFRLAGALVVVVVLLVVVVVGTAVVVGFLLITSSVKWHQMRITHLGTDKVRDNFFV